MNVINKRTNVSLYKGWALPLQLGALFSASYLPPPIINRTQSKYPFLRLLFLSFPTVSSNNIQNKSITSEYMALVSSFFHYFYKYTFLFYFLYNFDICFSLYPTYSYNSSRYRHIRCLHPAEPLPSPSKVQLQYFQSKALHLWKSHSLHWHL